MATEENKAEENKIYNNLEVLKTDITSLRKDLSTLKEEKERWFSEKERYGSEIREAIKSVKEAKRNRDKLTALVKENKSERDILEKEIKELSTGFDKLRNDCKDVYTKHNLQGTPGIIRSKIEALEKKVETEIIPFDKEKKIMKEIRTLKLSLNEFKVAEELNKEISSIRKDLNLKVKNSNMLARLIRENAAKSQVEHNKMLEISKKIDELKVKEEESFKKFTEFKEEYTKLNTDFKSKAGEIDSIKDVIKDKRDQTKKENVKKQQATLDEMKGKVDEKLKKGMKLTTEDLRIFQDSVRK